MNCKWIFKTKYNANGFVARTKVHLATMGFSQVEDINFIETLSPIAQMKSIQILFIVTTIQYSKVHQMDHKKESWVLQLPKFIRFS
jgi:hypothetical protein